MTEVEIFKQSLDVSRVVMIITIIMTIISITFSSLSLAFERSHNKKTVKPLCDLLKIVNQNTISISIKNAGLGPMIITSIFITDHNTGDILFDDLCTTLKEKYPQNISCKKVLNLIVSINQEKNILEISKITTESKSCFDYVVETISNKEIVINYKDIYDKVYSYNELILI